MSTLLPVLLSAPAEFVGQVDATDERIRPCARTLDEAFGPYARSSTALIVPMVVEHPMHPADRMVLRWSAYAAVALAAILIAERFVS